MFSMCIERVCVVTWESKICSVFVLREGALLQGKLIYVLYVF